MSNEDKNSNPSMEKLNEGWKFFDDNEFDKSLEIAESLKADETSEFQYSVNQLLGISHFRMGHYNLSEQVYENVCAHSEKPEDWFNLVTSSTLNSNFKKGRIAYDKAIELHNTNGTNQNLPIPYMMFYYMQCLKDMHQYKDAFGVMKDLSQVYAKLKITDRTYLFPKGVPDFYQYIESGRAIFDHIDSQLVKEWISDFKVNLDEDGKEYLDAITAELH